MRIAQTPWREAAPGYAFAFPRDHASHPDYKIEWWYYTGNVATATGRRFGYQLTFFRVGVDADAGESVALGDPRHLHGAPRRVGSATGGAIGSTSD